MTATFLVEIEVDPLDDLHLIAEELKEILLDNFVVIQTKPWARESTPAVIDPFTGTLGTELL